MSQHLFIANTLGYAVSDFRKDSSIDGMSFEEALRKAYSKGKVDLAMWSVVAAVNDRIMARDFSGFQEAIYHGIAAYGLATGDIGAFLTHCIFDVDPKFRAYARQNSLV